MLRYLAGGASALLLVIAGFFFWTSRAERESVVPAAPNGSAYAAADQSQGQDEDGVPDAPAASDKTKEEKRFARADKDDDGRITRDELLEPRRKAFAKLDTDHNGNLSFEEWAVKTTTKFAGADADRNGWLNAQEYASTKPKVKAKPTCSC